MNGLLQVITAVEFNCGRRAAPITFTEQVWMSNLSKAATQRLEVQIRTCDPLVKMH